MPRGASYLQVLRENPEAHISTLHRTDFALPALWLPGWRGGRSKGLRLRGMSDQFSQCLSLHDLGSVFMQLPSARAHAVGCRGFQ